MKIKDLTQVADQYRAYPSSFNGMREDNELKGEGNSLDFGARFYDPRYGKFLSLDPLYNKYPNISPYAAFANNPVIFVDPDGRNFKYSIKGNVITITMKNYVNSDEFDEDDLEEFSVNSSNTWNNDGAGWTIEHGGKNYIVKINIEYVQGTTQDIGENNIEITEDERSSVKGATYRDGKINEDSFEEWTRTHEEGHFLELNDHYRKRNFLIEVTFGSKKVIATEPISPFWKGNIMAEEPGKPDIKNIKSILELLPESNYRTSWQTGLEIKGVFDGTKINEEMLDGKRIEDDTNII